MNMKLIPKAQNGYVVQKGDTFGGIAQKHGLTVQQLQQLNPNIKNVDKISIGDTIYTSKQIKPKVKLINKPTSQRQNITLTNQNYLQYLSRMQRSFEEFHPTIKATVNTSNNKITNVLGYGLSYYINEDGTKRPFKKGETITRQGANQQLYRWQNLYAPKFIMDSLKLNNYNSFHPIVKFTLLDALFNVGEGVLNNSPNYKKALYEYNNSFKNGKSTYDISNIQKHADWNYNTTDSFIGLRSRLRRYPEKLDWSIINDNIYNHDAKWRDSVMTSWNRLVK